MSENSNSEVGQVEQRRARVEVHEEINATAGVVATRGHGPENSRTFRAG
jgi:hypothetical protein